MEVQNGKLIFLTLVVSFLNFFNINGITLLLIAVVIYEWVEYKIAINNIKNLKLNAYFSNKRALVNETVKFVVDVSNLSKSMTFNISIPELAVLKEGIKLNKDCSKVEFFHSYYKRGKKVVDKVFLSYRSPFFKVIRKFEVNAEIFIFPEIEFVNFNREKILELIPNLPSHIRLLEDPTHVVGVREYNNDPVKRIHWKMSAKFDKLLVKNYEFTSQGKLFIGLFLNLHPEVFSRNAWKPILKKYTEDVISGVAGIIKDAGEKNIPVHLLVDTESGVKTVFSRDWVEHFELLAQSYGSTEVFNYEVYEKIENDISYNDTLLIISMYLTKKDLPYILRLREKCSKIIVLILPYGFRKYSTKKFRSYFDIPPDIVEVQKNALVLRENDIFVEVYNENIAFQEGIEFVD